MLPTSKVSVWLVSILLQVPLQLFRLPVSDFHRSDSRVVRLLKLDRTVTYVLACLQFERVRTDQRRSSGLTIHLFPRFQEIFRI